MQIISFERLEIGAIRQVLQPENPKGELSYDPHHHYDYIVAFVAGKLGLKDNFRDLAGLFWFLEMVFAVLVLIKLCDFIFKNNRMVLCIAVMLFILLKSGETDQKTMVLPLYMLAVYYFLQGKWFISAVCTAGIFYLHVGLGIWWFMPSCIALGLMFFVQKKIAFKQIIKFVFLTISLASPILYFYLLRTRSPAIDAFAAKYYYYTCWSASSLLLAFKNKEWVMNITIMLAIFWVGYYKARSSGYKTENIIAIVTGVLFLYMLNFIFADIIGNGTAITLQLLRSVINIEVFSTLFFAFLIAQQIKKGNYFFLGIFFLLSFYANILRQFLGAHNLSLSFIIFYFIFIVYEIFEESVYRYLGVIKTRFNPGLLRFIDKWNNLLQCPALIAIILILLATPKLPGLKQFIKTGFRIPSGNSAKAWTQDDYLFSDIASYVDKNITDEALILAPFLKIDFDFYTKHKTFINFSTPILGAQYGYDGPKFKKIVESDLAYPLAKLFENYSNDNFNKKWQMLWERLDEDIIRRWKKEYQLTHVVREKELPLDFPIIYENRFYRIYEIR